jgi:hypothetical protein
MADVTDSDSGLGGNAPCIENYIGIWASEDIGYDPHAVHGLEANDGGFVGVGLA